MTIYHHPFPLRCYQAIKTCTLSYMSQFNEDNLYVKDIILDPEIVEAFNQEMAEYNLPGIINCLAFKRRGLFDINSSRCHIDRTATEGYVHSSIVIPLEGCVNTHMYWMKGEYLTRHKLIANVNYDDLIWRFEPTLIDQVEVLDEPVLARVDLPHSATSPSDGSYRSVLSIRLLGNPSMEEIIETRFHSQ